MKVVHSPEIIEQLKQIHKLMDLRINQLKDFDPQHWWELSLKDDMYSFLCHKYSEIKSLEIKPRIEITEEEKKNLLSGLTQLSDGVTKERLLDL